MLALTHALLPALYYPALLRQPFAQKDLSGLGPSPGRNPGKRRPGRLLCADPLPPCAKVLSRGFGKFVRSTHDPHPSRGFAYHLTLLRILFQEATQAHKMREFLSESQALSNQGTENHGSNTSRFPAYIFPSSPRRTLDSRAAGSHSSAISAIRLSTVSRGDGAPHPPVHGVIETALLVLSLRKEERYGSIGL